MKPNFFRSSATFRAWLAEHHRTAPELLVGFHKKGSGTPGMTWPESVDEALCFGWIDGIRKRLDDLSYTIRFSPRRPRSIWSAVNIRRAGELLALGLMAPAGLPEPYAGAMNKNRAAWAFLQTQPPSYRKTMGWWVVSAKKEETRVKRLKLLVADSAAGRRR